MPPTTRRKRQPIGTPTKVAPAPVKVVDPLAGVDPRLVRTVRELVAGRWADVQLVDVRRTRVELVLPNVRT